MRIVHSVLAMATAALVACGGEKAAQNKPNTSAPGGEAGSTATGAAAPSSSAAAPAAPAPTAQGPMTVPSWMKVDKGAKTVTLDIHAGQTAANNHWNFNGHFKGDATITVPEGYKVTIKFTNDDPSLAHSIGVDSAYTTFPATFTNPQPIFPGAISSNPTDMTKATQPKHSETLKFTAAKAGDYTLNCFIPGHALTGMWIRFDVSADGKAGVTTS